MANIRCISCDKFAHASEMSELSNQCQRCFAVSVCFAEQYVSTQPESASSPKKNTEKSAPESVAIALLAISSTGLASVVDQIKRDGSGSFVKLQIRVDGIAGDATHLSFDLVNQTGDILAHVGDNSFKVGESAVFPRIPE